VAEQVATYVAANRSSIEEQRWKALGSTISAIKGNTELKWANALDVKNEVDSQFLKLLGPKDERDAPPKKVCLFTNS
jgi:glutaminyl-tRNA synthetase